jgi:hypothetical protein
VQVLRLRIEDTIYLLIKNRAFCWGRDNSTRKDCRKRFKDFIGKIRVTIIVIFVFFVSHPLNIITICRGLSF